MPIYAAADGARGEAVLGEVHERRHPLKHGFFVDFVERYVAFQAARKGLKLLQPKFTQNLTDLLPVIAAFDQQALRQHAAGGETRVARKDNPMLGLSLRATRRSEEHTSELQP